MRSLSEDHLDKITPWFLEVPQDLGKASESCLCRDAGGQRPHRREALVGAAGEIFTACPTPAAKNALHNSFRQTIKRRHVHARPATATATATTTTSVAVIWLAMPRRAAPALSLTLCFTPRTGCAGAVAQCSVRARVCVRVCVRARVVMGPRRMQWAGGGDGFCELAAPCVRRARREVASLVRTGTCSVQCKVAVRTASCHPYVRLVPPACHS